jgi:DNA-binding MarR family transcriptional regulator
MWRTCLSANLRKTERMVTRHYDSYLEEAGVTAVQLPIIAMIASAPEPTFRMLSEELDLDRSTLSRNLAVLRERGLLDIGPSSGPKPGAITLTREGETTLARAHKAWQKAHRALEKSLSPNEMAGAVKVLRNVRSTLRSGKD